MPGDLKYLIILLVTLGAGSAWSFMERADKASRWNSCDSQISTIQALIKKQPAPSKAIVFLGASSTMNGIDALELNRLLKARAMSCVNLGVNWFGHEMQLSILEAWLERHQPKKVVVEVPTLYRYYLHPHLVFHQSPLVMKALWKASPERAIIPSLCQGPRFLLQNFLPESVFASALHGRLECGGTLVVEQSESQVLQSLQNAQKILAQAPQKLVDSSALQNSYRHFRYAPELEFLKAIQQLCQEKKVPLVFLALPNCGFQTLEPELLKVYQSLAPVWQTPWELLQKAPYWRDAGHLNATGARELAQWLAQKIESE